MDEKKTRLRSGAALFLTSGDADTLLSLADGDCTLLYLYYLRSGGGESARSAAETLHFTPERIAAAEDRLRRAGLLDTDGSGVMLPPADELPEYRAEDLARRSREDKTFRSLVNEAQSRLGHALSGADLKTLFGIYDHLGLPCDVIMLLINRCAEDMHRRYGEGRLPTMRAIEKEAYVWCNREILTLEQAEEYLTFLDRREERSERLRQLLQIRDRQPTGTERRYMEQWLDMDFPEEALELAYDRTVTQTGRMVWKYMDSILRAWQEKGLRTVAEIEKGDFRPGRKTASPARSGGNVVSPWQGDDLDKLKKT